MKRIIHILVVLLISTSLSGCFLFDPDPEPVPPPSGWGYVELSGVVRDVRNVPIVGARVYTSQNDRNDNVTYSLSEGKFLMKKALIQKNSYFQVLATMDGYNNLSLEPYNLMITESYDTKACNIWLYKPNDYAVLTYRGYVRDSAGNPLENAKVTVLFQTAFEVGSSAYSITDADGKYYLSNILSKAPHCLQLYVECNDFQSYMTFYIDVRYDATYDKDFILYHNLQTINITGRTIDQFGIGVSSEITISGYCRTPFSINISTDQDGNYTAQGVAIEEKTYLTVTAKKAGFQDAQLSKLIPTGGGSVNLADLVLVPITPPIP